MYIINIKKLEKDIKEKGLSEKESYEYILVSLLFTSFLASLFTSLFAYLPYVGLGEGFNYFDSIFTAACFIVTYFGLRHVYKKNGGDEGKDFVKNFTALWWVYNIRTLVYSVFFIILFVLGYALNYNYNNVIVSLSFGLLSLLILAYIYYRIGQSFERIK